MKATTHPLADDYLRRLDRAARGLPGSERDALLADIRSHLDAGLAVSASEADVRNLLSELGAPEDIAAAARPERRPNRRGPREIFALVLLLTGMPPVLGWLVGVGLLLWSPLWTRRQKLLGVLVWPGGSLVVAAGATLALIGMSSGSCPVPVGGPSDTPIACPTTTGPSLWSIAASILIFVAPVLVAAYLYRAAGRQAEST